MNLVCVGISHHTAPLETRERLWFSDQEVRTALPRAIQTLGTEAVLYSTCNRTELYALAIDPAAAVEPMKQFLLAQKGVAGTVPPEQLFVHTGSDAVDHLFRVASGIDSMVLGDVQILAQVRVGYQTAVEQGTAGLFMNRLFQLASRVGKRARTETTIGEGAVSVSYAAVELAERIFDGLRAKTALVIGAGETAELTAKHLQGREIGKLIVTNRTFEKANALAQNVGGTAVPFDQWMEHLPAVDIVISSVEVSRYVLMAADVARLQKIRRTDGPLFLIDIGVPRNLDPEIRSLENVFLYDLDTLNQMVAENLQKRGEQIPKVESIIGEVLKELVEWYGSLEVNPTIGALTEMMERIRSEELARHINRFEQKDRELAELVTKRIVNKILHSPIVNLRNGHSRPVAERLQRMHAIRELFGLSHGTRNDDDDA